MSTDRFLSVKVLLACAAFALPLVADARGKYPDTTDDGLQRITAKTGFDAVYAQPGADLARYKKIMIDYAQVSFRKNWERDQNNERGLSNRVDASDMTRIRATLADELRKVFEDELRKKGGYEIVTQAGDDVLRIEPSIVDLDINAPDVMSPGMSRTYTTSAGEMTLNLELRDSGTNAVLGRVIDHKEDWSDSHIEITNSITNRAAADQALRSWAASLVKALDDIRQ